MSSALVVRGVEAPLGGRALKVTAVAVLAADAVPMAVRVISGETTSTGPVEAVLSVERVTVRLGVILGLGQR